MAPDCQDMTPGLTSDPGPVFLSRVLSLPAFNDACSLAVSAYASAKERHEYVGVVLRTAEKGVRVAATTALPLAAPIVDRVGGWECVDRWACLGLDKVELAAPIIKRPTKEIFSTTRHYLLGSLAGDAPAPASLKAALASRATHTAESVAESKGGKKVVELASNVADRLLDTGHSLVDTYVPPGEGDLHEPDPRDSGLAEKGVSLAHKVRRRLVKTVNRRIMDDSEANCEDATATAQRLVDLGWKSLLAWFSEVRQMSPTQMVASSVSLYLEVGRASARVVAGLAMDTVSKTRALVAMPGNGHPAVEATRAVRRMVGGGATGARKVVAVGVGTAQSLLRGGVSAAQKVARSSIHCAQYTVIGGKNAVVGVAQRVMTGSASFAQAAMTRGKGATREGLEVAHRGLQTGMGMTLTALATLAVLGSKTAEHVSAAVPAPVALTAHAFREQVGARLPPVQRVLNSGRSLSPSGMWNTIAELREASVATRAQEWAAEAIRAGTAAIKHQVGGNEETMPASSSPSCQPSPQPDPLPGDPQPFPCQAFGVESPSALAMSPGPDGLPAPPVEFSCSSPCSALPFPSPSSARSRAETPTHVSVEDSHTNCCLSCGEVSSAESSSGLDIIISLTSPVRKVDVESASSLVLCGGDDDASHVGSARANFSAPPSMSVSLMASSGVGITTTLAHPVRFVDVETACCCCSDPQPAGGDFPSSDPCKDLSEDALTPNGRDPEYIEVALRWNRLDSVNLKDRHDPPAAAEASAELEEMPSRTHVFSSGVQETAICPYSQKTTAEGENGAHDPSVTDGLVAVALTESLPRNLLQDILPAGALLELSSSGETGSDERPGTPSGEASQEEFLNGQLFGDDLEDTFPTVALKDSLPMVTLGDTPGSVSSGYCSSDPGFSPASWWANPSGWQEGSAAWAQGPGPRNRFLDPHERHHLLNTRRAHDERLRDNWSTGWSPSEYPSGAQGLYLEEEGEGEWSWPQRRRGRKGRRSRWWW